MPLDYVEVNWDKPRKLFFDWESLEALGQASGGLGFGEIQERLGKLDFRLMRRVIWYALKHYDRQVKEDHIPGILATARKNGVYLPKILKDVGQALDESEVFAENKDKDVAPGDGSAPPPDPS